MNRRTASIAGTVLTFAVSAVVTGWVLLWVSTNLPASTVIVWTGVTAAVAVAGIAVMWLTAERGDPSAADENGTEDADEYLRPLRTGAGKTANKLTVDFARLRWLPARLAAARENRRAGVTSPAPVAAPEDVPGWDAQGRTATVTSGGLSHAATHATRSGEPAVSAGGLPAPKHARPKPPPSRWRGLRDYWRSPRKAPPVVAALAASFAYFPAPLPGSPARETPPPGSEGSGLTGQEAATEVLAPAQEAPHACCLHSEGPGEHDCCLHPRARTPLRRLVDYSTAEADLAHRQERLANAGEIRAAREDAPVPDVAHEEAAEAPAELPGAEDDPGPLYSWRTGEFAAIVAEGGAS